MEEYKLLLKGENTPKLNHFYPTQCKISVHVCVGFTCVHGCTERVGVTCVYGEGSCYMGVWGGWVLHG